MSDSDLIVCEKLGAWAVALRGKGLKIRETRSLAECKDELRTGKVAFACLELTPTNTDPLLAFLVDVAFCFPRTRVAVMSQPPLRPLEGLLREAGAIHVTHSPRHLAVLLRLAQRHLQRAEPNGTLREQIWQRLPWDEYTH